LGRWLIGASSVVAMADDGGVAEVCQPSLAMAHLGEDGYSILVT